MKTGHRWQRGLRRKLSTCMDGTCLVQRVRYVHVAFLATIWYTAQIFPTPATYTQPLTTAILWFIWQVATFRVSLPTLQKPKIQGAWELLDIAEKSGAVLVRHMWVHSKKERTATATWLGAWGLVGYQANPPNAGRIPNKLAYLLHYALDMAYFAPTVQAETIQHFARRLYSTLQQMAVVGKGSREMRVVQKSPTIAWDRVWRNLHASCVSEKLQSAWYSVIHDIIPTNERLIVIHRMDTDVCRQCRRPDTLPHRLTECVNGTAFWDWTQRRVAMLLRTSPRHVSSDWILSPHFYFWPPQRQRAILWTLDHIIWYRMQGQRRQSLTDFIDSKRRSR